MAVDGEGMVQSKARLLGAERGWGLWRNNVGVLKDEGGRPIRFGLANDSAKLNKAMKSSDLIGLRPVIITPEMVGKVIGQFVSIEVKGNGWVYRGTPREVAQQHWINIINELGGYAKFISHEEQL